MPHDKNGQPLQVGDIVNVKAKIISIYTGDKYCNLSLETVENMYPGDYKTGLTLNAKQITREE